MGPVDPSRTMQCNVWQRNNSSFQGM